MLWEGRRGERGREGRREGEREGGRKEGEGGWRETEDGES